jgi:hypothetical protein
MRPLKCEAPGGYPAFRNPAEDQKLPETVARLQTEVGCLPAPLAGTPLAGSARDRHVDAGAQS